MRAVIVDFARRRRAARRGGGAPRASLALQGADKAVGGEEEILRVNEALEQLAALDHRMAQLVEFRSFGGIEVEIAEALGITDRTVRRNWEQARLWLADALCG